MATARKRGDLPVPKALFEPLAGANGIVLAVSGGADSTALLVLAARWGGAPLFAATVDHGLRAASRAEAASVAALCETLGVPHRILTWSGDKPDTGIESAARDARYHLLTGFAHEAGADYLATAHTRDDQAETVLMRLAAGSGPAGLSGMAGAISRDGITHVRPLLDLAKADLVAFLEAEGIGWIEDPMNADPAFARPRLRAAKAALEREGLTDARLATLARRMARAERAIEAAANAAWRVTAARQGAAILLNRAALQALPEEIALRLLGRAVAEVGGGVVRLERLEALVDAMRNDENTPARTLAGARIEARGPLLYVTPAPPRRR